MSITTTTICMSPKKWELTHKVKIKITIIINNINKNNNNNNNNNSISDSCRTYFGPHNGRRV